MQENENQDPNLVNIFVKAIGQLDPKFVINEHFSRLALKPTDEFTVIGFGKAVYQMAVAVECNGSVSRKSILSVPMGQIEEPPLLRIRVMKGAANNLPDDNSLSATKEILNVISELNEKSQLIILISGGGSACLPGIIHPMTLKKKCSIIQHLSISGASINDINAVRKRLSSVKGGKLIQSIPEIVEKVTVFVLSDVLGDPLDVIASGTTTPNTDDLNAAENILRKYNIPLTTDVLEVLNKTKDEMSQKSFERVQHVFVGNLRMALNFTHDILRRDHHVKVIKLNQQIQGEASVIGRKFGEMVLGFLKGVVEIPQVLIPDEQEEFLKNNLRDMLVESPICFIGGGETVVSMDPKDPSLGTGGRNQEMVLSFTQVMSQNKDLLSNSHLKIEFLSCGTDGIDGPTDAGGALFTDRLLHEDLPIEDYLKRHDSYGYFSTVNQGQNHIKIGHTGTNVLDIQILKICLKQT